VCANNNNNKTNEKNQEKKTTSPSFLPSFLPSLSLYLFFLAGHFLKKKMSHPSSSSSSSSTVDRERLLTANERMQTSTDRLKQIQIVALDTEEVGNNIMHDLHNQRDVIKHGSDSMRHVEENVENASRTLRLMDHRLGLLRATVAICVFLSLFIVVLIIVIKLDGQ